MEPPVHIYIFGDQTSYTEDGLQDLLYVSDNGLLATFLNEAFLAIQREVRKLPATERARIPQAETLGLLIEVSKKNGPSAALNSALCCVYQIGYYIYLLSQKQERMPLQETYFVGFCTGAFAAAAISCLNNLFELSHIGVEATIAAFQTGLYVQRRAEVLGDTKGTTWSVVVSTDNERETIEAVEEFCQGKSIPPSLQPYISAVSATSVTISGPVDTVGELLRTPVLAGKRSFSVPIYGPYHSSQIYTESDVQRLVHSTLEQVLFQEHVAKIPTLSGSSGEITIGDTFGYLLRTSIIDILLKQVRIDKVTDGLLTLVRDVDSTTVTPIGAPTAHVLAASLTRQGKRVEMDNVKLFSNLSHSESRRPDIDSSKIAIIGFSGRFPDADNLSEFWDLLRQGLDVHKPVPADRFDWQAHHDPTLRDKNTSRIRDGCWIRSPGLFDARFFHISPREACQSDPAQRLALLTAYEALEMAGFVPDRTASSQRHRVGVFYGTTSDDWREVNSGQNIDTYFIPGGNRAFVPGRINYFFKFSGPSISVDTACSSSLAAINIACKSLLNRDCDTAVAGGANIMTNPDNFAGLDRGHFLCPSGNCKTFDDGADGYCRADGVGTVILKRLSDAMADKDPVFGVILGSHTNHSAEAISITRPLADAQEYLFKKILNESGIRPHDVNYIEMHGTGTQAGDAVEMQSVLNTFAWDNSRTSAQNLFLGSVKSNIGHGESASGVSALIKVLLMMQKSKITPHCGIKTKINRGFPKDLENRGVRIASAEVDWKRPRQGKRRAFVNNFSAAGGNSAVLIEDAALEETTANATDPRANHIVTVSARSVKSLKQNLITLANFVEGSVSNDMLPQLSYSTTARRIHHNFRVAVVASDRKNLQRLLVEEARVADIKRPAPIDRSVCFLFSGQGCQYTAMAQGVYQNFSSFRRDVDDFDCIAIGQGFPSILPLITGSSEIEALSPTVIQLGTCIMQMALARLWINLGLKPQYVIGHSLGEYAALQVVGVLSIHDTIYLCGARATLLENLCTSETHGMVAIKASKVQLAEVIANGRAEIACINGPNETVLSGENGCMGDMCERLTKLGFKFTKLALPYAFHSSQVDPILQGLETLAHAVDFKPPTLPIVSTLLATVVDAGGIIGPTYISRQCRETVDFHGAVQAAQERNLMKPSHFYVEIGAHPTLSRLMKSIFGPDTGCYPSLRRSEDTFRTFPESLCALYLAGLNISWDTYHHDFPSCQKVIEIPRYSWDYDNYWIQYQNDWCLTKGNPVEMTPLAARAKEPLRLSSSVHDVLEQVISDDAAFILSQSDLKDPELRLVADGHLVNGVVLVPSGLFADVAYTLSQHLLRLQYPRSCHLVPDICDMVVEKALVMNENAQQLFRAALTIEWGAQRGKMELYSVDDSEKRTRLHAKCTIQFQDPRVWLEEWQRNLHFVQRSMESLMRGVTEGSSHKVRHGLAYKLFTSVVTYSPTYQGMEEVVFDSEGLEATAIVRLQPVTGRYELNPFWADSLGHISGFIMHSNDTLDHTKYAFINHGWRYMRLAKPYTRGAVYHTYVKMQPIREDNSVYSGDVYMIQNNQIVAAYGGVTFNRVPRKVLNMALAPRSKAIGQALPQTASTRPGMHTAILPPPRALPAREVGSKKIFPAEDAILQQVLKVVSDETGVDIRQLGGESHFADFGVDSLLSLGIISTLRETLDLDISSSLFEEYPSVNELTDYLVGISSSGQSSTTVPSSTSDHLTTPSKMHGEDVDPKQNTAPGVEASIGILLRLLAEEVGTSVKELSRVDHLTEIGVDSLVALTFVSRVREELDIDLPHDIFLEYTKLADLMAALRKLMQPEYEESPPMPVHPPATSAILQGGIGCSRTLFMFPDGSGSSTSYTSIPKISPDLLVYGLNCPYLKQPEDLQCSLQELTGPYLVEIRRRQPKGPYFLAGWSAGGIAAYDAAQQLVNQGEVVEQLILLDSPNPIGLGKLPPRFYKFLESKGVFGVSGGQSPPTWLIKHFLAFIDALDRYQPTPFSPAHATPKTTIIWAKDGVCKTDTDERPEAQQDDAKEISWLLENRSDFGPNGWDQLLGERNISIECIDEANHFSLMRAPATTVLAAILRKTLARGE